MEPFAIPIAALIVTIASFVAAQWAAARKADGRRSADPDELPAGEASIEYWQRFMRELVKPLYESLDRIERKLDRIVRRKED